MEVTATNRSAAETPLVPNVNMLSLTKRVALLILQHYSYTSRRSVKFPYACTMHTHIVHHAFIDDMYTNYCVIGVHWGISMLAEFSLLTVWLDSVSCV